MHRQYCDLNPAPLVLTPTPFSEKNRFSFKHYSNLKCNFLIQQTLPIRVPDCHEDHKSKNIFSLSGLSLRKFNIKHVQKEKETCFTNFDQQKCKHKNVNDKETKGSQCCRLSIYRSDLKLWLTLSNRSPTHIHLWHQQNISKLNRISD